VITLLLFVTVLGGWIASTKDFVHLIPRRQNAVILS
jgi:hypothetical protein